jgi:transcriptional regulator with XRE-family HTH domain
MIKVLTIMGREKNFLLPSLQRLLAEMGENIRLARLRRKFSTIIVAQRAGISRNTLRSIERGDPSVTFGAYVNVLVCLGLEKDLKQIALDDILGRKLQDANLPTKARAPRLKQMLTSIKKKKHE